MKAYINLTLVVAMLLFVGCSVESLEDSSLEERHLTTEATRNQPFVIQGFGDLVVTPAHSAYNTECEGYTLIEGEGISTEATLGHFTTTTRICADRSQYPEHYDIRGVHTFPSGDELYFRSIEYVNIAGKRQMLIMFDGGTGIFAGAAGTVDMNEEVDYVSPTEGTYTNSGEGMLMIDRGI